MVRRTNLTLSFLSSSWLDKGRLGDRVSRQLWLRELNPWGNLLCGVAHGDPLCINPGGHDELDAARDPSRQVGVSEALHPNE